MSRMQGSMSMRLYFMIGIGGMIGAVARYTVSLTFVEYESFPYATLFTNFTGCFFLTFLLNSHYVRQKLSMQTRTALTTGVIGSFTTFSTFALETVRIWDSQVFIAIIYILLSVFGGVIFCYVGYKVATYEKRSDII